MSLDSMCIGEACQHVRTHTYTHNTHRDTHNFSPQTCRSCVRLRPMMACALVQRGTQWSLQRWPHVAGTASSSTGIEEEGGECTGQQPIDLHHTIHINPILSCLSCIATVSVCTFEVCNIKLTVEVCAIARHLH